MAKNPQQEEAQKHIKIRNKYQLHWESANPFVLALNKYEKENKEYNK